LSPSACSLLGARATTSVQTLTDFLQNFCPGDRQELGVRIPGALKRGEDVDVEARVDSSGIAPQWVRIRAKPAGHALFPKWVGSISDISAQKLQELQLKQMHDELAGCMRTEIIGGLSGTLVHELKQPLAAILSNAQAAERMLRRSPLNVEELTEVVKDIIDDDSRAADIIVHLRSLFRNDGKHWDVCNINKIVQDAIKVLNRFQDQGQTRIAFKFDSEPLNVRGNRIQLQQVILNLVINAIESMSESNSAGQSVTIETHKNGNAVKVSVEDWGTGVPEEIQSRIFDPSFTTKTQGLGLGLSICRSIMSAHGGWIELLSAKDRGATFVVTLPLAQEDTECQDKKTQPSS
jgi:two-component system sensor kinase FixL